MILKPRPGEEIVVEIEGKSLKIAVCESDSHRGFYIYAYQPDDKGRKGTVYDLRLDKSAGQDQGTSHPNPGGT